MDTVVKVGAAIVSVLQLGAKHLQHLSHSTDAFAFIANQHESMADSAKQAAAHAKHAARMSEVEAVARFIMHLEPVLPCQKCQRNAFAFETFCKACGHDLEIEQGTGTYSES